MRRRRWRGAPDPGSETSVLPRGIGLAAAAVTLTVLGIGFASQPLTVIGLATTAAVVVAAGWIAGRIALTRASISEVRRTVSPATLSVGSEAHASVDIRGRGPLLRALRLREQAATELTAGAPTRASIRRHPDGVTLEYALTPVRRGRWTIGPALFRAADPFGLAWADRPVGGILEVAVWPAVVDLAGTAGELVATESQVRAGARTPAADDAALRDYRDGDDLRRVHWASSARRGTLLVRAEEQQGHAAATVLLALPPGADALEWAVSAAASVALSVITFGHPVRLVVDENETVVHDAHGRAGETGRARLLDATVDLTVAASTAASDRALARAAALVEPGARDAVVAIMEPAGPAAITALAPLGEHGRAWAVVRSSLGARARAQRTVEALSAEGWHAVHSLEPEPIEAAWSQLLAKAAP